MAAKGGGAGGGKSGAIRAGGAYVEVFADDISVYRSLEKLKSYLNSFGRLSRTAGVAAITAGAGLIAPVAAMFSSVVSRDVELKRLADRFGDTVENMSAFAYAADATGINLEQLKDVLENLPERVDDAVQGGGEAAEVFKRMGISAQQFMQLPLSEKMAALADGLKGFGADSRNSILGKIFSDKGQMFGELFDGGSEKLRKLMAEAGTVGQVVTAEDAANAMKVNGAISRAWAAAKGVAYSIGSALLPEASAITKATDWVLKAAASVREFIVQNKSMIMNVIMGGTALIAIGATLIGVGYGFSIMATAVGGIASALMAVKIAAATAIGGLLGVKAVVALFMFLLTPLGMATAALVAIGAYVAYQASQTETAKKAAEEFGQAWSFAKETAIDAWGGIRAAISAGNLELAFKIGVLGIKTIWTGLLVTLTDKWGKFKGYFVDAWYDAVKLFKIGWIEATAAGVDLVLRMLGHLIKNYKTQLSELLKTAASTAQIIGNISASVDPFNGAAIKAGLDVVAKDIDDFQKMIANGTLNNSVIELARKANQQEKNRNLNKVEVDRSKQQDASDEARKAALDAAKADFKWTLFEMNTAVEQAKKLEDAAKKKMEQNNKKIAELPRQFAELTRSASGARDFTKIFSAGDTVNQQILNSNKDNGKKIEKVTETLKEGFASIGGGLVFTP